MLASIYRTLRDIKSYLERRYYTRFVKTQVASHGDGLRVNGPTNLNTKTILGDDVNFNGLTVSGEGKLTIGDHFHSGRECLVITQNHNYMGEELPYDDSYVFKPVTIEDNVWFGHRVTILPGVTIGEGAIIQAGSVVVDDVPERAIVGGSPAKTFASRDDEHYDRLRKAQLQDE